MQKQGSESLKNPLTSNISSYIVHMVKFYHLHNVAKYYNIGVSKGHILVFICPLGTNFKNKIKRYDKNSNKTCNRYRPS